MRLNTDRPKKRARQTGVRLTEEQFNTLREKARMLTDGNLSQYLLYAALNFKPTKKDLVNE